MLATLPADSVHCVVTSPPYWGLRAYGAEPQIWGGDPECRHDWAAAARKPRAGAGRHGKTSEMIRKGRAVTEAQVSAFQSGRGEFCSSCAAWRGELGLEPTLDLYLAHIVEVFRALRRVLRPDGTLWLNIGDCYATVPAGRSPERYKASGADDLTFREKPFSTIGGTLKSKDRVMLPARVALALQEDGWWLRDEIVWHKPNPMPASVKDRTTPAHEMIYLLTKRAKYFYDHVAIMEPIADASIKRYAQPTIDSQTGGSKQDAYEAGFTGQSARSRRPNEIIKDLARQMNGAALAGRNKRSVWTVASEPFAGAHFATFATRLVEPMILAGTSAKGVCPHCGAPWRRVVNRKFTPQEDAPHSAGRAAGQTAPDTRWSGSARGTVSTKTTDWRPSCRCPDHKPVPATILDPFGGSGTVGLVANRLGRDAVLIELKPDYTGMAKKRIMADAPLLAEVTA